MTRPRLLVLSFSPIASDARVLKQVEAFSERYELVTCGYGPAPAGVARHLQIPDDARADDTDFRLIAARLYRAAYSSTGAVRAARGLLQGLEPDVVLANDVESVPLALEVAPASRIHADLHEYSPRLHDDVPAWVRWRAPYVRWTCRRAVARVASTTTVGEGLARQYEEDFGFRARVVTNATPYAPLEPGAVSGTIRLVHSGAALRNRDLALLLDAAERTTTPVTLDLYLAANEPAYLDELRERARGSERVTVHDAVPYAELVGLLNTYDVGIHVLPPVNFNNRWALPNKFFDYAQARLALVVGPSPEMAGTVRRLGLGRVADDFGVDALVRVLDALTPAQVVAAKAASHAAARDLSAESQVAGWVAAVDTIAAGVAGGGRS